MDDFLSQSGNQVNRKTEVTYLYFGIKEQENNKLTIFSENERKVLPNSTKRTKRVKLVIVCQNQFANKIHEYIIEKYQDISELSKKQLKADENSTKITCVMDVITRKPIKDLYKSFQTLDGIDSISIQETIDW